nr:uncharacterized protein LOC120962782 [Aegilops tauschii subsp. strangulata]
MSPSDGGADPSSGAGCGNQGEGEEINVDYHHRQVAREQPTVVVAFRLATEKSWSGGVSKRMQLASPLPAARRSSPAFSFSPFPSPSFFPFSMFFHLRLPLCRLSLCSSASMEIAAPRVPSPVRLRSTPVVLASHVSCRLPHIVVHHGCQPDRAWAREAPRSLRCTALLSSNRLPVAAISRRLASSCFGSLASESVSSSEFLCIH